MPARTIHGNRFSTFYASTAHTHNNNHRTQHTLPLFGVYLCNIRCCSNANEKQRTHKWRTSICGVNFGRFFPGFVVPIKCLLVAFSEDLFLASQKYGRIGNVSALKCEHWTDNEIDDIQLAFWHGPKESRMITCSTSLGTLFFWRQRRQLLHWRMRHGCLAIELEFSRTISH